MSLKIRARGASHRSHEIRIVSATAVTSTAAGVAIRIIRPSGPKDDSPSGSRLSSSGPPIRPTACGSCLMMMRRPMPVSIPLITDDGK